MASIESKVLFITTSPRTPAKMVPEIELLSNNFSGLEWNNETQVAFMNLLREENFFNGEGAQDPAFSARDRINRAPKSLGFVTLSPTIQLTSAGRALVSSKRKEEVFLRQLLKFQLPSPFHRPKPNAANFWVKPYLELFRLIRHFGTLSFDEIKMFGLQLTDYRCFYEIVEKINRFRDEKSRNKWNYKSFLMDYFMRELHFIYADDISRGQTKTRESADRTITKFLNTKASNMRDYADACVRYLRATGLINVSHIGKSVSIMPEKIDEVDFFLENTDREPCFVTDEYQYVAYLGNVEIPKLMNDDKEMLIQTLSTEFPDVQFDKNSTLTDLKDVLYENISRKKDDIIHQQIITLKNKQMYEDIKNVFIQIKNKELYDIPLMLEWNTWRAMTMLDGGDIHANLKFDDFGNPMSTAQGNLSDIVCDYGDFAVTVEVTMSSGQRQYETEGEPVARHLAKYKEKVAKPTYCLFIAPSINPACIAHFYVLQKTDIGYYGGKSTIIPIELSVFEQMIDDSYNSEYVPNPERVKHFFESAKEMALTSENEMLWYDSVKSMALKWLA